MPFNYYYKTRLTFLQKHETAFDWFVVLFEHDWLDSIIEERSSRDRANQLENRLLLHTLADILSIEFEAIELHGVYEAVQ